MTFAITTQSILESERLSRSIETIGAPSGGRATRDHHDEGIYNLDY